MTGDPTYDFILQRLENFQSTFGKDSKIRILLVTTNPGDPGGHWSTKRRDYWIKSIVSEISKYKDEMSLAIKIHPFGEILLYQFIKKRILLRYWKKLMLWSVHLQVLLL